MMTPEQIVASHKASVETLFGLTAKAFEGVEKMVELNLSVAKAAAPVTDQLLDRKSAKKTAKKVAKNVESISAVA